MLVALGLSPCLGLGSLTWETRQIQLDAKLGDKEAVAVFHFKNTGSAAIVITQIQPTCTCTTVDLFKWSYAPGESGEIKAVFTFGDRVGPQEKFINVTTDDPVTPITLLSLQITIPELLSYTPRILRWTKGSPPTEQSVAIAVAESHRISTVEITDPKPEAFTVRIEPVEPGKKYALFVRPVALAETTNVPLSIHCLARLEDGTVHPLLVYLIVR